MGSKKLGACYWNCFLGNWVRISAISGGMRCHLPCLTAPPRSCRARSEPPACLRYISNTGPASGDVYPTVGLDVSRGRACETRDLRHLNGRALRFHFRALFAPHSSPLKPKPSTQTLDPTPTSASHSSVRTSTQHEYGTHKTVKAKSWPSPPRKTPLTMTGKTREVKTVTLHPDPTPYPLNPAPSPQSLHPTP